MFVFSRYWSQFYANDCVFSRNGQQKVYLLSFSFSTIATATGFVKFNHNCRFSSSAYFLASLMMEWRPLCTASSSNDLTAAIVGSALQ